MPEPSATEPQRPVVVIPGILGSKLVAENGDILWGDRGSLAHFHHLDLDPTGAGTEITAVGLVERICLLGPFWTVHFYDDLLAHLRTLRFHDGRTLFAFAYDWRQSNYETARHFDAWVRETDALRDGDFDVVAHSMGGIVAKIWMLKHGGAQRDRKVIYLGTPFQGSMNALAVLSNGWGPFQNVLGGGIDAIRNTVLSFPSVYELFPRYARNARLGDQRTYEPLNIYDAEVWNARDWLPHAYRDGAPRAAAFSTNLRRAESLSDLMSTEIFGPTEIKIAGDNQNTRHYLYVSKSNQSWQSWRFSSDRGDGTVPLWSAANAKDGNLSGSLPAFAEHATIFRDAYVKTVLRNELVITAPLPVNANEPVLISSSGTQLRLDVMDARLDPPLVEPNSHSRLVVSARLSADAPINHGDLSGLTARLAGTDAPPLPLVEITDDAGLAENTLSFAADLQAPATESIYRIDIDVPPLGQRAVYLTVGRP